MRRLTPCLLLALAAAPALGDGLDVSIDAGDRVRGTIDPATQVDVFRLDLPQDARLSVLARPRSSSRYRNPPPIRLRLLGPSLMPVGTDDTNNGRRASTIRGYDVATSGEHRIEVRGDGHAFGDYELRAKFKTDRRQKFRDLVLDPDGTTLTFSAPGGTEVDVTAQTERGSSALPRIREVRLDEPGAAPIAQPVIGLVDGRRHALKDLLLRETGDYEIELVDVAGSGEPCRVTLVLRTPRASRRRIGLREQDIGPLPGDVDVVVSVLARPGGTTAVARIPADPDEARASLTVPAGALGDGALVVLGLGPVFAAPEGSGLLPVGRPLYIGPDGLALPRLATGTVGYDAAAVEGDLGALRIVHRDASATLIVFDAAAITVDDDAESISFPAGRAGEYGAFRHFPPPTLVTLNPFVGGTLGGYHVSIFGAGFRTGNLQSGFPIVGITLDGVQIDVQIVQVEPTYVTFVAPPHAAGDVTLGVIDRETGLISQLPTGSFEYR